uniref:Uncharacterized protein n=1 Tax=Panagrolaimus superbus TaxID=310955 RepID=A0A914YCI8_9BILA
MVSAIDKIQLKSDSDDSGYDTINDIEEGSDNNDNVGEVLYFTMKTDAGKSFLMKIDENKLIDTLMSEIQETCGVPFERQYFTCFDESTLSDQFWENEYEKLFNDIKECRKDTADMITALENFYLNNSDNAIDEASYYCESEKSNNN